MEFMSNGWIAFIVVAVIAGAGYGAFKLFFEYRAIESVEGTSTPYFVRGPWGTQVFFRSYQGDGLMGSYRYTELAGVLRSSFRVEDVKVRFDEEAELGLTPVGRDGDGMFHFGRRLPIQTKEEKIEIIFRTYGGPVAIVSDQAVYLWQNSKYIREFENGVRPDRASFARFQSRPEDAQLYPPTDYFADSKFLFFANGREAVHLADGNRATFKLLGSIGFAKDSSTVYFAGRKIADADPASFALIGRTEEVGGAYAKDKKRVYYLGRVLEGENPETFVPTLGAVPPPPPDVDR